MWRSFFLAIGIYVFLLGAECLAVDKFVLKKRQPPAPNAASEEAPKAGPKTEVVPPDWAPWSLMSTGAVVCLYSFTIPRRVNSG